MLQEITLRNFKILEEVTIDPGLITVLIGPNGTGKSSIFQALGLIKQSMNQDKLKVDGPLVFGDFSDFLHRGNRTPFNEGEITFGLNVAITQPVGSFFPTKGTFLYQASFRNGLLVKHEAKVIREDGHLFIESAYSRDSGRKLADPQWLPMEADPEVNFQIAFASYEIVALPFFIINTRGVNKPEYRKDADRFVTLLTEALKNAYIVPALRGFDKLSYQQLPVPVQEIDLMMSGKTFEERAQVVANVLLHDLDIQSKVSEWTTRVTARTASRRAALDLPYHIALETSDGKAKFNIAHEGFGTSQLLYLFTQMALAPNKSTICVDEPEIHLHPKAQAALSEVLVDIALSEGKQLMLSTHSEHILMTLLTLVAEDRLKPDDLAVYYFQRNEDGDSATAERIEVNSKGQIRGGIGNFFATDEEADRYIKTWLKKAEVWSEFSYQMKM